MGQMREKKYTIGNVNLYDIRNINEIKVVEAMKRIIPEYPQFDNCMLCIQDVYALSMTKVKPRYVQNGTVLLRKRDDNELIESAVRLAIGLVMKNPNHP